MFEHHASYVINWISHLCVQAMRRDDMTEATRLANLATDVAALFPEAKAELDALGKDGQSHTATV